MDLDTAMAFVRSHRNGILVTLKSDGRPQSSNIVYTVTDDGTVKVSLTAGRAKTANMRRDPRVSLHVNADDFWSYAVVEADADLSAVASAPDDAAVEELIEVYRAVAGEHPNWDEYRASMVADGRQVLRMRPRYAYGMVRSA